MSDKNDKMTPEPVTVNIEKTTENKSNGFKDYFSKTVRYGITTVIIYLFLIYGLENIIDRYDIMYNLSYLLIGIIVSFFIFRTLSSLSKVSWFYLESSLSKKGIGEAMVKSLLGLFSVGLAYLVFMPLLEEDLDDTVLLVINSVFVLIGLVYAIPFAKGFFSFVDSIGERLEKEKKK